LCCQFTNRALGNSLVVGDSAVSIETEARKGLTRDSSATTNMRGRRSAAQSSFQPQQPQQQLSSRPMSKSDSKALREEKRESGSTDGATANLQTSAIPIHLLNQSFADPPPTRAEEAIYTASSVHSCQQLQPATIAVLTAATTGE
jgi:hypothetical protein